VEICTGMSEQVAEAVRVFPNPTDGDLTLVWEQEGDVFIELLDAQGRVVATERVHMVKGERHVMPLAQHLADGVYTLRSNTLEGRWTTRIVVR
jgi:hypothetical protein